MPHDVVMIRGALVVVVLALLSGCASGVEANVPTTKEPAAVYTPEPLVVHYEVSGSDGATSASLTVQTPTGTSQMDADLPVRNKSGSKGLIFSSFSPGDFLYVSAQNQDEYGTVTCRIKEGSTVVSENTASGAYQIATCQAQA